MCKETGGISVSKQSEERLFIGITPNGIETCREPDIIEKAKHGNINALYYAMLPKAGSADWHTIHKEWTFKQSGTLLVVYQQPLQLEDFPVVDVAEENSVETRYKYMLAEARMALRNGGPLPGYEIELDKPLTYVFVYELPKFVVALKKGKYVLERAKSLNDIIYRIEENFCSKEDIEQHYRNNATNDFDDYRSIGCGHPDD